MHKFILLPFFISFMSVIQTDIKMSGSDTMYPMMKKLSNYFNKKNPDFNIRVKGGGSGIGIQDLQADSVDVALVSRELKNEEEDCLRIKELHYFVVAYDALAMIVNPVNKVHKLTEEQLADIFTGKIKNWKELGGKDLDILVFIRRPTSGTYHFVKEHVLDMHDYSTSALTCENTEQIIKSVSQAPGGIGFVGIGYLNEKVSPLYVSFNVSGGFAKPNIENAVNGIYPITRPLYMIFPQEKEKTLLPFLTFLLSDQGKKVIRESGYIPISGEIVLQRFLNLVQDHFDQGK